MSDRIVTHHLSPYLAVQDTESNIEAMKAKLAADHISPVPHPMASFEDTTHAYECGYRDGLKAAQAEITRLKAERDRARDEAKAERLVQGALRQKAESERDAIAAAAFEAAARDCKDRRQGWLSPYIRALTPADAKATLDRMLEAAAPAVKVKPLVWEGFISGSYRIDIEKGGIARLLYYSAAIFDEEEPEQIRGGYLSLVSMDDLKADAQSHHEARILAALEGGAA